MFAFERSNAGAMFLCPVANSGERIWGALSERPSRRAGGRTPAAAPATSGAEAEEPPIRRGKLETGSTGRPPASSTWAMIRRSSRGAETFAREPKPVWKFCCPVQRVSVVCWEWLTELLSRELNGELL